MRKFILSILATLLLAVPMSAQKVNLDFPGLAERAEEVVDVTLDSQMLKVAAKFLDDDRDGRAVRGMINGLQGIYVRSYEFASENEYDRGLADRVKSQLGATWKPLVTVRSKTKDNVHIMADMRGENVAGLVIISAEPKEFTVVNIVGNIDIDRLASLEGEFGIPHISRNRGDKDKDDDND